MSTELPTNGPLVPSTPAPAPSPGGEAAPTPLFEEHYTGLLSKFQALRPEELVPVNLDIPSAVTTALGVGPEVVAMKERVVKECPLFDASNIERLDTYAMALSHAHTLYLMASQPTDELQPLIEEGTKLRETLYTDASALVQRQMLNGAQLKDLHGPVGYKNLAFDLQILAALFRESFSALQGKCATQASEIHRADEIAASILRAVGLREQGPASVAATADIRQRAFTFFTRAYDEVRRVVSYLRWKEEDVDTIIPSLFAGRGGRKKVVETPPPAPTATVPATNAPGSTTATAQGVSPGAPRPIAPAPTTKTGSSTTDPFLS